MCCIALEVTDVEAASKELLELKSQVLIQTTEACLSNKELYDAMITFYRLGEVREVLMK